jgi:hypothetical protein
MRNGISASGSQDAPLSVCRIIVVDPPLTVSLLPSAFANCNVDLICKLPEQLNMPSRIISGFNTFSSLFVRKQGSAVWDLK